MSSFSFFVLSYRSFASIVWLSVLLFYRISVHANLCVPASVCVSCSFFLGGSSLFFRSFVCFVLLQFVFISSVLRSLSNEKEQERKVDLVRWERSGRSRGGP